MEIYEVVQDFDFKELLFENDNSSRRTLEFKGQSLKEGWQPLSLILNNGKTKKEKQKREDFDASCFFNGTLFLRKKLEDIITFSLCENVELLPVTVDTNADDFVFLNVLNCVEAINFSDLNSYEDKMNMLRGTEIKFIRYNVEDKIIFRDKLLTSFYYCTKKFISFVEMNNIKGLKFNVVGYAI